MGVNQESAQKRLAAYADSQVPEDAEQHQLAAALQIAHGLDYWVLSRVPLPAA